MSPRQQRPVVPDALAPPPRHPRFPLLDGMRAAAALAIVVFHVVFVETVPGGSSFFARLAAHLNVGVAVFFVLSGFLLFRPFVAGRGGGPAPPSAGAYLWRRGLRIFPAYWLALTVLTILPGITGLHGGHWLGQYLLIQNLPPAGSAACSNALFDCDLAQTWSLGVELTFYLALPLYALAIARRPARSSPEVWALIQLVVLTSIAVVSVWLRFRSGLPEVGSWVGGTAIGFGYWFALGMGLAVLSVRNPDGPPRALRGLWRRPWVPWLAAATVYVALCESLPPGAFIFDRSDQVAEHLTFGVIAVLLLLPAVFGPPEVGLPARVLSHPAMRWLGLVSYGIFLWHYVFALELSKVDGLPLVAALAMTLAGAIATAAASYYLVERPILRLKNLRPAPAT
jgi:peptidoglycan/LPS O-acetylase OafA/YrhL